MRLTPTTMAVRMRTCGSGLTNGPSAWGPSSGGDPSVTIAVVMKKRKMPVWKMLSPMTFATRFLMVISM